MFDLRHDPVSENSLMNSCLQHVPDCRGTTGGENLPPGALLHAACDVIPARKRPLFYYVQNILVVPRNPGPVMIIIIFFFHNDYVGENVL